MALDADAYARSATKKTAAKQAAAERQYHHFESTLPAMMPATMATGVAAIATSHTQGPHDSGRVNVPR
jgi:hypothetical protein